MPSLPLQSVIFVLLLGGCVSTPTPKTATPTPSSRPAATRPAYLPAAFRKPARGPLKLAVTIQELYVADGRPFATDASLLAYLRDRQRRAFHSYATITAAPRLPYRAILRAMDLVRGTGFVNIVFVPQKKKK